MEESLKAVRLIHQIIIGAAAAILAFALSPEPRPQYEAALVEVSALKKLQFKDYAVFVNEQFTTYDPQTLKEIQEQYRNAFREVPETSGNPISVDFKLRYPLRCEWPASNATLGDYIRFFEQDSKIEGILGTRDPLAIKESLQRAVSNIKRGTAKSDTASIPLPSGATLSSITFSLPGKAPDYNLPSQGDEKDGTAIFTELSQKDLEDETLHLSFVYTDGGERHLLTGNAPVTPLTYEITGPHAKNWLVLREPGIYQALANNTDGKDELFKNTRALSNQINGMKLDDAAKFLQDKLDSTKREISFLGISVEERIAVWIGPLLLLILSAYLLSHLRNLPEINDETRRIYQTFPWIGFFSDRLSKAFTYLSIAFLPVFSSTVLLWRSGHWPELPTIIGGLLSVLSIVLGIWGSREVVLLERQRNLYMIQDKGEHSAAT